MRWEKAASLLELARSLAGTAEGLSLDDIAAQLEVNRRTAERMRDSLRELFPALEEISDGRSKRFRIPGSMDAFFRAPTSDELAELEIAVQTLEQHGGTARAALLRSLNGKMRATLRSQQRQRIAPDLEALLQGGSLVMQAGPKPMADATALAILRDALKAACLCSFDYATSRGHHYRRHVAPYGILFGRTYYLVGPELDKSQPVLWRLDRMSGLELGKGFGGAPPTFDLRDYAARSFGTFQEPPEQIALRFSQAAAPDARRFDFHPRQVQEEEPDGSLVVRFHAGGLLELVHHLFGWGDAVEIIAPERLKSLMLETLEIALASHGKCVKPKA